MKLPSYFHRAAAKITKKRLIVSVLSLVGVFILLNLAVYIVFHGRTYPSSSIGKVSLGSQGFSAVTARLSLSNLLPAAVEITQEDKTETVNPLSLVTAVNAGETISALADQRSWLPVLNLFRQHQTPPVLAFNEAELAEESQRLSEVFSWPVQDAKIELRKGLFILVPSRPGYNRPAEEMRDGLSLAIANGQSSLKLNESKVEPKLTSAELGDDYGRLRAQQNTPLSYSYSGLRVQVSPQTIGGWYEPKGVSYELSQTKLKVYLRSQAERWSISIDNLDAAVAETVKALQNTKQLSFGLTGQKIVRTYTYCTALKGVSSSYLNDFIAKLAEVYQDRRGWSLGGKVVFKRVSSGCQFTAWLAAAQQVPSFGTICDSTWSCRVGRNVVINFDRWQNASPAWNAGGGSLNDYRSMVINHETGHWLGYGHRSCGGSGQLAPVMQQQSIDLQGCKFNSWPTASELAALRENL